MKNTIYQCTQHLFGCASTSIKDGKLQKRTILIELTPFFEVETSTEGLEIGEAIIIDDE